MGFPIQYSKIASNDDFRSFKFEMRDLCRERNK